jgi:hypothetical protein
VLERGGLTTSQFSNYFFKNFFLLIFPDVARVRWSGGRGGGVPPPKKFPPIFSHTFSLKGQLRSQVTRGCWRGGRRGVPLKKKKGREAAHNYLVYIYLYIPLKKPVFQFLTKFCVCSGNL